MAFSTVFLVFMFSGTVDLGRAFFTKIMLDSVISEGAHWTAAYPGCIKYGTAYDVTAAAQIPSECQGTNSILGRMRQETEALNASQIVGSSVDVYSITGTSKRLDQVNAGDIVVIKINYKITTITPLMQLITGETMTVGSEAKEIVRGSTLPDTIGKPMSDTGLASQAKVSSVQQETSGSELCTSGAPNVSFIPVAATGFRIYAADGFGNPTGPILKDVTWASLGDTLARTSTAGYTITLSSINTPGSDGTNYGGNTQPIAVVAYNTIGGVTTENTTHANGVVICSQLQMVMSPTSTCHDPVTSPPNGSVTFAWSRPTGAIWDSTATWVDIVRIGGSSSEHTMVNSTTGGDYLFTGAAGERTASYAIYASDGTNRLGYLSSVSSGYTGYTATSVNISCPSADLSASFTESKTTYLTTGDNIIFTYQATNSGPDTATNLQANLKFVTTSSVTMSWSCDVATDLCPTATTGTVTGTTANVVINFTGVTSGTTKTFKVHLTITGSGGTLTSSYSVGSGAGPNSDYTASNNTATDLTAFENTSTDADLTVAASAGNLTYYTAGSSNTYTFTVTNNGVQAAPNGVTISSSLPSGFNSYSWSCTGCNSTAGTTTNSFTGTITGSWAAGSSATVTVTFTPATTQTGDVLVNSTAVLVSPGVITDPSSPNTLTSTLKRQADVVISESTTLATYANGATYTAASPISTVTITNNGPNNLTTASGGLVTVALTYDTSVFSTFSWTFTPSGTATCTAASGTGNINTTVGLSRISGSNSVTFTLYGVVKFTSSANIINSITATVPATSYDPSTPNNATINLAVGTSSQLTNVTFVTCASSGSNRILTFSWNSYSWPAATTAYAQNTSWGGNTAFATFTSTGGTVSVSDDWTAHGGAVNFTITAYNGTNAITQSTSASVTVPKSTTGSSDTTGCK